MRGRGEFASQLSSRAPASAVLVCAALLASLPVAKSARANRLSPAWSPAGGESALTGAVIVLRTPGPQMVRVPAGAFAMGSTELELVEALAECAREAGRPVRPNDELLGDCQQETLAAELWRHPVRLSSFWLDRTEVTTRDYERCVQLGTCRPLPRAGTNRFLQPDHPVSFVTYDDAVTYCRFRRSRLPTEAEWERAARGPAGRRYPWGDRYNGRLANHGRLGLDRSDPRDGFSGVAPAGSFPDGRTPEGFLDLAGNVAEWVSDWYSPGYRRPRAVDPQGPPGPLAGGGVSARVVRGGDWLSAAPLLRGAARRAADANLRAPTVGFRCARSAGATRRSR